MKLLAPEKEKNNILQPMKQISTKIFSLKNEKSKYKEKFVPAGQTTQLIVGASPETDLKIISLSESLYQKFKLKRVYYSAYISVNNDKNLPALKEPPLLRENRLYQADWLMRFYGFKASELLNDNNPNFNHLLDPKCDWAIRNIDKFPIDVNKANYYTLLRVPGIGMTSAKRIIRARRTFNLSLENLKGLGVVLKRAKYFITCSGEYYDHVNLFSQKFIQNNLLLQETLKFPSKHNFSQLSLFDNENILHPTKEDKIKCLTGNL